MADNITIPADKAIKSTPMATRKSWVGGAWGLIVGSLLSIPVAITVALVAPILVPLVPLVGMVAGGLIGANMGKNAGEKIDNQEAATGKKEVRKPTFFNWKIAKYYLTAVLVAAPINIANQFLRRVSPVASLVVGAVVGIGSISAIIYGGLKGKNEMQVEYDHAKDVDAAEKQNAITAAVAKAQDKAPEVAPQQTQEVAQPKTNFVAQEEQRRAAAATQQNAVA